jgi:hypothetical protein
MSLNATKCSSDLNVGPTLFWEGAHGLRSEHQNGRNELHVNDE